MDARTTTTVWRALETCHAIVYYAPERPHHYETLGLKGGWMGYFASRSAALGEVPTGVVAALFHNFKPSFVARSLPDAWRFTTPELALAARQAVVDDALRRLLDDDVDSAHLREAAALAVDAVAACDPAARPLFAAHAALPVPEQPHLRLAWAAAALREFRGDGHIAALTAHEIDGCEAQVLMVALGLVPPDQRTYRGWTPDDWAAAVHRLADRGWVTAEGTITEDGRRARADVEDLTDRLARQPWDALGASATGRLAAALTPISARIVTNGGLPYPNGIGVPPVPELAASR